MKTSKTLAALGLVLVTFIWGATFVMVKDALNDIDPYFFAGFRFGIATVLSFFLLKRDESLSPIEIIGGLYCGIFLFAGYAFQNYGLILTSPSRSAFITSVSVILVPLIQVFFLRKKVKNKLWISIGLATIGLYMLLNPGNEKINLGDIITFGCALSFAVHILFQDQYVNKKIRIINFFFFQSLVVTILSFLFNGVFESNITQFSYSVTSALFITGLLATFVSFLIMIWAQKILSPSETALIFSLEPVFAAMIAFLVIGESLGYLGWIGGLLVVVGVTLSNSD
jgi:drug/metabolite transporter (DMT)-like permease